MRLLRWAIFTNLYISAGAMAFLALSARLLGLDLDAHIYLLLLAGGSTWLVYQLSRLAFHGRAIASPKVDSIYLWLENSPVFTRASIVVSGLCTLVCLFFLRLESIVLLFGLGLIALTYPLNIPLTEGKTFRLRDLPFIKLFLIAMVWSGMAVLLPVVELKGWSGLEMDVWTLFALQFLFILSITLPFDINDEKIDSLTQVKTIPNVFGVQVAKMLTAFFTFCFFSGMTLWLYENVGLDARVLIFDLTLGVMMLFLLFLTLRYSVQVSKWRIMLWYDGSFFWYFLLVYFLMR